jgi:hypothetical protein
MISCCSYYSCCYRLRSSHITPGMPFMVSTFCLAYAFGVNLFSCRLSHTRWPVGKPPDLPNPRFLADLCIHSHSVSYAAHPLRQTHLLIMDLRLLNEHLGYLPSQHTSFLAYAKNPARFTNVLSCLWCIGKPSNLLSDSSPHGFETRRYPVCSIVISHIPDHVFYCMIYGWIQLGISSSQFSQILALASTFTVPWSVIPKDFHLRSLPTFWFSHHKGDTTSKFQSVYCSLTPWIFGPLFSS